MGVRILHDSRRDLATLYCATTDWAFGPVFYDDKRHDAEERAESFLRWLLPADARRLSDKKLADKYGEWRAQEVAQWKAEAEAERLSDALEDTPDQ